MCPSWPRVGPGKPAPPNALPAAAVPAYAFAEALLYARLLPRFAPWAPEAAITAVSKRRNLGDGRVSIIASVSGMVERLIASPDAMRSLFQPSTSIYKDAPDGERTCSSIIPDREDARRDVGGNETTAHLFLADAKTRSEDGNRWRFARYLAKPKIGSSVGQLATTTSSRFRSFPENTSPRAPSSRRGGSCKSEREPASLLSNL